MTVMQPKTAFAEALRPPPGAGRTVDASLRFRRSGSRTFLAKQFTPHPFHITRPFYVEGDPESMATLYLQSSSGGLYGDDNLGLSIAVESGAAAHVTSQASTMVPAGLGGCARLSVELTAESGATAEYVPDPLILFDGAEAETTLDVTVAPDAVAIFSDAVVFHNPGGGLPASGRWHNTIRLSVEGDDRPRLIERQHLDLGDLGALALGPAPAEACYGALYCTGIETEAAAATLSAALAMLGSAGQSGTGPIYWGVSPLSSKGIVGARFLCRDGASLTAALEAAWMGARRAYSAGHPARRRK